MLKYLDVILELDEKLEQSVWRHRLTSNRKKCNVEQFYVIDEVWQTKTPQKRKIVDGNFFS